MAAITRLSAFGYGTRRNGSFLRPSVVALPGTLAFAALVEGVVTRVVAEDGVVTILTVTTALVEAAVTRVSAADGTVTVLTTTDALVTRATATDEG